jgi:hypothetical protein
MTADSTETALSDIVLSPVAATVLAELTDPATTSPRFMVEEVARERQVRFSPDSCRRLFAALVNGLPRRKWADLSLAAGALLRCTGPWPGDLT